jgi:hypothetical protein
MLNEQLLWSAQNARIQTQVERILSSVRRHLAMDVGFVSEFRDGKRKFRFVDKEPEIPIDAGGADPLRESYCHYVARGAIAPALERRQGKSHHQRHEGHA